jgi:hypothetical protein
MNRSFIYNGTVLSHGDQVRVKVYNVTVIGRLLVPHIKEESSAQVYFCNNIKGVPSTEAERLGCDYAYRFNTQDPMIAGISNIEKI